MWDRICALLEDGSPGRVSFVRDLIGSFHGRSVQLLAQLAQALTDEDIDAIQVHAQVITESGRTLGARDMVIIGEQIEADAGVEDLEACLSNLPHLMQSVIDARERLDVLSEHLLPKD